ncbi:MAG: hypothetical protein ABWK01_09130 [Infirmifilum sp.]
MKLRRVLEALLILIFIHQLLEVYVFYTLKPALVEISRIEKTPGDKILIGARLYFPNPYPLPIKIYSISLKLKCSNTAVNSNLFNITLIPKKTNILLFNFSPADQPIGNCLALYNFVPDTLILSFLDLHIFNFTGNTTLTPPAISEPFLWAGWNTTEINVGDCVSYEVYTYPPAPFEVTVLADYLSMPPVAVSSSKGIATGNFTFCPREPSSFKLKGYYLLVASQGKTWTQEETYPPRLEVSP